MFCWFTRGDARVRYDAREISAMHFELRITGPEGLERVERFDSAPALHKRQMAFERELAAAGWTGHTDGSVKSSVAS
jgi:hypothetical protein